MTSTEGLHEPDRFGPWLKGQPLPPPVPGQSLAWLCQKQGSDEQALVELHFGGAGLGLQLREAVAANEALVPLGAERLLQTDRLILRSDEGWQNPPPGTFQYWVAREIAADAPPATFTEAILRQATASFQALTSAVSNSRLTFAPVADDFSLTSSGDLRIARVGLPSTAEDPPDSAWRTFLDRLPLDATSRPGAAAAGAPEAPVQTPTPEAPPAPEEGEAQAPISIEVREDPVPVQSLPPRAREDALVAPAETLSDKDAVNQLVDDALKDMEWLWTDPSRQTTFPPHRRIDFAEGVLRISLPLPNKIYVFDSERRTVTRKSPFLGLSFGNETKTFGETSLGFVVQPYAGLLQTGAGPQFSLVLTGPDEWTLWSSRVPDALSGLEPFVAAIKRAGVRIDPPRILRPISSWSED